MPVDYEQLLIEANERIEALEHENQRLSERLTDIEMADEPARVPFRAGDLVRIKTLSPEEWVLACDEDNGHVLPAYCLPTRINVDDVELVTAATDEQRLDMLARYGEPNLDFRQALAARQLSKAR